VPRRVTVPATDDLFRPTVVPEPGAPASPVELVEAEPAAPAPAPGDASPAARTASGRVKHDEKMTIYVTGDELIDIEDARLQLRRSHGLAVDRGRLVRAAVAIALADLDSQGGDCALVQRLREG
jgi:L-alanine-DL-glutamate epimerase-like enolase superfamily enzyme